MIDESFVFLIILLIIFEESGLNVFKYVMHIHSYIQCINIQYFEYLEAI